MQVNLTPILEAVLALVSALITAFVIPWIKSKTTAQQRQTLLQLVDVAVAAVEQLGENEEWDGAKKKAEAIAWLEARGFTIDAEIDYAIESAVLKLHNELEYYDLSEVSLDE